MRFGECSDQAEVGADELVRDGPVVELTGDNWLMGTFTFAILGQVIGQRGIAGISCGRFRRATDAFLAVLSCVMACSMFVSLVIL